MEPVATKDPSGLMRKRSHALAYVWLTRRKGVVVEDTEAGAGVDLVVTLPARRKAGLRQFGVALRYTLEGVTAEQGNIALQSSWLVPDSGPFPFPVVLFFFTMRNDGAWYSWVAEPVVSDDGKALLPLRTEPDCRPLDDDALNELLDRVNRWYDAHYSSLSAVGSSTKRAKKT